MGARPNARRPRRAAQRCSSRGLARGPPVSIVCRSAGLLRSRSGISPMAASTYRTGEHTGMSGGRINHGPWQPGMEVRRWVSRRPGPEVGSPYRPCADPSDSFARDRGISPTGGKHESHREHTVFGFFVVGRSRRLGCFFPAPSNRRPHRSLFASAVPCRGTALALVGNLPSGNRLAGSEGSRGGMGPGRTTIGLGVFSPVARAFLGQNPRARPEMGGRDR
jgi:hypothetical protein